MKPNNTYTKHIYWLNKKEEESLRLELLSKNIKLKNAKGVPCTPLDEITKIASVDPEVWNDICNRQGSWYRNSPKYGLYLIVSSFDLKNFEQKKEAIITRSSFTPPSLATEKDKQELISNPKFIKKIPHQWKDFNEREIKIHLRWIKKLGSNIEDYDYLHLSHTANHANFIFPRFFIRQKENIIPYSIDVTTHLCSCCLELFQIIGGEFHKKLVAPCPGATIFARLHADKYLLVEKQN